MESLFGVDFDFMNDERMARRLKRKWVGKKESKVNNSYSRSLKRAFEDQNGTVDEDYWCFLNQLTEYSESWNSIIQDDDESSEDDDDEDIQYKMFLENLKEDGKSYVLKVAVNNKVPVYIKYEAEGSSDDKLELPIMRQSTSLVDIESLKAAKNLRLEMQKNLMNLYRDVMDSGKSTSNCVGSETTGLVADKYMAPEPVNLVSRKENGFSSGKHCPKDSCLIEIDSEDDIVDESYQIYLNGIKGEALIENDSKHEMEDCLVDESYQIYLNGIKGEALIENDSEHEMEDGLVDESYQIYLNGIKGEADCTVITIEDAKLVKCEKMDGESSSDSEVLVALNASDFNQGNYSPFETSKLYYTLTEEDDQHGLRNPNSSNHSGFREKLMDKLRKSFDHEEYEKLWQDITEQRLKERFFHLRSGEKTCKKSNEPGLSYLEQYPVLEEKIDAVHKDKRKELNLLRGFFFWLQNVVQKDAFPPWLDPLCLEVMPKNQEEDSASSEPSDMQVFV